MRDQTIKLGIEEGLASELGPDVVDIGVAAREGVVTLSGFAPSQATRRRADRIAQRSPGVRAVANDVEVHLPLPSPRTDAQLARAAAAAIEAETDLAPGRIWVSANRSWVYLEGEVESDDDRAAAERVIATVPGVRGVSNQIKVRPPSPCCSIWPMTEERVDGAR